MDVWGKQGITCVNTEGDILPNSTFLNMISVINPMDACNIQAKPTRMRQISLTHLANEIKLETSLGGKHGNTPHANGKIHVVFTCETNETSPLRTQIKMPGTHKKVLYNALLDTRPSHNLLSLNAWNQLKRLALTRSDFKVKGVNGQTSYVLAAIIHCVNDHMQGSFCVFPVGTLFKNVFLGRTCMVATKCTMNWATNKVTTVTSSCPTSSHCMHCSLQKLTLPKGP